MAKSSTMAKTSAIAKMVALLGLSVALFGCGNLADPVDAEPPAEELREAPEAVRTAEQGLDFEAGLDFDHAAPVIRHVRRCDECESMRILHVKSEDDGEDEGQKKKSARDMLDEIADGNPVPFPLDEKKPLFD
ncbi:hypothetical protein FIV42_06705 [Persicimonas caeni]|uniref:Cytochrome c n=2 Tax=Persicimonas caeni TaxID=2292766 RepID=A0A4Y6PQD3_PERCE|nr:hypothetical protein [Persicimonas caeni]QDG50433.1 hypothetical protein FIV42_06705 [Persicimonas caeni]